MGKHERPLPSPEEHLEELEELLTSTLDDVVWARHGGYYPWDKGETRKPGRHARTDDTDPWGWR